jgi:hypothetical protein
MSTCRSCDAPIVWMRTEPSAERASRNIPIDAAAGSDDEVRPLSLPDGNLELTGKHTPGRFGPIAEVRYVAAGKGTYRTHFASCPNAKQHRRD